MKFKNPYQKHGFILLFIFGLYLIIIRGLNIQIPFPLTLVKILIVASLSIVFISIATFMYQNSSSKYFLLKKLSILTGCFFIVAFLIYFVFYYPVARDLKYCTNNALTQLRAISENSNKEELDLQTQCQIVKPRISSFNRCVDTVREMNGGLVTDIVFKLASLPSGADGRIKKIEITCSPY